MILELRAILIYRGGGLDVYERPLIGMHFTAAGGGGGGGGW